MSGEQVCESISTRYLGWHVQVPICNGVDALHQRCCLGVLYKKHPAFCWGGCGGRGLCSGSSCMCSVCIIIQVDAHARMSLRCCGASASTTAKAQRGEYLLAVLSAIVRCLSRAQG